LSKLLFQLLCFGSVGGASAVGHYGLLITLVQGFGFEPVRASVAGALLGALINYTLNYHFTFRSKTHHVESVTKFGLVAGFGLLWNTLLMWLGVNVLHTHYLLTQVFATVLVFFWSFGANRYWTFRRDLHSD
jgi:putative flippase GtrA